MYLKSVAGFLISMLIFCGGMVAENASAESATGPSLFLSETDYEFTDVQDGEEVRHHFILRNRGELPLYINDVETD